MSGIRYSDSEKAKVLNFIYQYDQNHGGRGGKLQAFKKFKVSPLTIRGWIAEQGKKPKAEKVEPSKLKAVKKSFPAKAPVQVSADLREKITSHIDRIQNYSFQIAELQAKIENEKAAIQKDIE